MYTKINFFNPKREISYFARILHMKNNDPPGNRPGLPTNKKPPKPFPTKNHCWDKPTRQPTKVEQPIPASGQKLPISKFDK